MWSGYVSKERKRVLLTPIFANQPVWEALGAQVMGLPGQSLLLQFSGNIFFRKLSLQRFIVWFVGQYMAPNQRYFQSDFDYLTCHVCCKKNWQTRRGKLYKGIKTISEEAVWFVPLTCITAICSLRGNPGSWLKVRVMQGQQRWGGLK